MRDLLEAVRKLYAAMERFDADAAAQLGVDRSGLRAVNAMESGPIGPGSLSEELGLTSGSITALLDRLAEAGHIERVLSRADGRRRDAYLTDGARQRAGEIYGKLGAAITMQFATKSASETQAIRSDLFALAEAFDLARKPNSPEMFEKFPYALPSEDHASD